MKRERIFGSWRAVALLTSLIITSACATREPPSGSTGPTHSSAPPLSLAALARADSLFDQALTAMRADQFADAARLWGEAAGVAGYDRVALAHHAAASAHARLGQPDSAFHHLRQAVSADYIALDRLISDPNLTALYSDPRWQEIIAGVRSNRERLRNPENARFGTEDIARFWRAYDLAAQEVTREGKIAVFRREYLERGSPGLIDFYRARIGSAEQLLEAIEQHPAYYASLRESTARIADLEPEVRQGMRRMKELYPEALFPDVYALIGRLNSGGTLSERALLIGAEMHAVTPETRIEELPLGLQKAVKPLPGLPHTVAHELIHFLQNQTGVPRGKTLLYHSLREGIAEFVAELASPAPEPPYYRTWGDAQERRVWERFQRDMHSTETRDWVANLGRATKDWPADLGYYMGFQIAKAFYEHAPDKQQAIRDLIRLESPERILKESRYAERFQD